MCGLRSCFHLASAGLFNPLYDRCDEKQLNVYYCWSNTVDALPSEYQVEYEVYADKMHIKVRDSCFDLSVQTTPGHYRILQHDDVIKWKHFPRYWPFVRGIHRSPVNSPHKGQWRGALMFSLICVWINDWANNREAGDLRRYRAHYYVTVMRLLNHWTLVYMYLRQWTGSSLVQVVAWCRIGTKPLPGTMLSHWQFVLRGTNFN